MLTLIPLFISIIAGICCILLYRKKVGQLLLRLGALCILYLLISNFSFQYQREINSSPPIMLVDFSPSVLPLLHSIFGILDSLNFPFQKFFFSDSVYADTTGVNPRFTNITQALTFAAKLVPSAIILISDGNHNLGPPPEEIIKDFKIPIYCFGVGEQIKSNQAIAEIFYPDYAFLNDTIKVEVVIEATGLGNKIGKINLITEKSTLKKECKLSEQYARQSVVFDLVPTRTGTQRFKIKLEPQVSESNYLDNEQEFLITVFEKKASVLYYTDHPSFNTFFISRALKENPDIELASVIQIAPGRYEGIGKWVNENRIVLSAFDILILDNIDAITYDKKFRDFLAPKKGLLVCGNIYGMSAALNEILPFKVSGSQYLQDLPVKIIIPFSILAPGIEYPAVSRINQVLGVNQNAVLIAQAGSFPVLGYRKLVSGVVFQINISDLGVWQFIQSNLNNQDILKKLINDIIRFLSPYGGSTRLWVKIPKSKYHPGEIVKLYLKAYDQNLRLGSGGEFYLEYQNKKIPFIETRPGYYETQFSAEKAGTYTLWVKGTLQNDTLHSNPLNLEVTAEEKESEEWLNVSRLEQIAKMTKGAYYDISMLKTFKPPAGETRYEIINFTFDKPFFYLLIFMLILIDWIIRKKGGMV